MSRKRIQMAESIIQPEAGNTPPSQETNSEAGMDSAGTAEETAAGLEEQQQAETEPQPVPVSSSQGTGEAGSLVIWTPRFIVIFALALVVGLSAESLLTQGWLNGYFPGPWVFLVHVALILGCWIAVLVVTRSRWLRLSGVFGCIWAVANVINFALGFTGERPPILIIAPLVAIFSSALLGAYICLSIDRTPLRRWDTWFFRLAPLIGFPPIILIYLVTSAGIFTLAPLTGDIEALALILSVLVWWARPSCWKAQPGPALLFGLYPAILFCLSLPGFGGKENDFFLPQVALLCLVLGMMRILQAELRRKVESRQAERQG